MSVLPTSRIVIAGGGLVSTVAIDTLRRAGHSGPITVLGAEPCAPYARPPLSKAVLVGKEPADSTLLSFPLDGVNFRVGTTASALDLVGRTVLTSQGERVPFDGLIVATGARARRLPEFPDALTLRTLDDLTELRRQFVGCQSVHVVGSGFLALEIASAAREAGLAVCLSLRRAALVSRVGSELADALIDGARQHGVELVDASDSDGVEADFTVAAVGCQANVEWLEDSLPIDHGLVTDEFGRVADAVVAAGDVAQFPIAGRRSGRTPTWTSAIAQATTAALTLIGSESAPHDTTPYLWTEAFGLNCKMSGTWPPTGPMRVVQGDWSARSAVLAWPGTAVAVNTRIPIARLASVAHEEQR